MADTPDIPRPESGSGKFGFLGRKMGPLPIWAWAVIAVAGYYWYTHYGPGKTSTANAGAGTGTSTGSFTETITRKLPGGRPHKRPPKDDDDGAESGVSAPANMTGAPAHERPQHRRIPGGTHYTGNGNETTKITGRWQHPDTAVTEENNPGVIDVIAHRPLGV